MVRISLRKEARASGFQHGIRLREKAPVFIPDCVGAAESVYEGRLAQRRFSKSVGRDPEPRRAGRAAPRVGRDAETAVCTPGLRTLQ